MDPRHLTANINYYEDFSVGQVFRHARGKTVGEFDNVMLSQLMMNTAQGHFNEHLMRTTPFGQRLVFGGLTMALVIGLASQDTAENVLAELEVDQVRLKSPVVHGDTLYAYSEVLETADAQPDAGRIVFRHLGFNQKDEQVFECRRAVLMRRRAPRGLA